ncbi:KDO2-lipid IV(A) lauroyltransferase [Alteromonadaceae bacterium Bs31]|nr:KDO2-lipid IV(A) lauroyltransferase [Alteromonadaceae bacterium Bs31]
MARVAFSKSLLLPRYWLSWAGMGLWWLLVQVLPFRLQVLLGSFLGAALYKTNSSRKRIAEKNIEICFPELSRAEKKLMLRETLRSTGIGVFESGAAWFWPKWRLKKRFVVSGLDHLERAVGEGKGVLFMGIHFTPIEIGAACVNLVSCIDGFYRPHTNPIYEYVQALGRIWRNTRSQVIPNDDVRGIVRSLRAGRAVNYAPDQDYGKRRSVFVPFFGIQAATVKAPAQLMKAGRAEIIPWTTKRLGDNSYQITIFAPITSELGKGEQEDAMTINRFVEARVRENPEQYLWVHRRFKTRPEGEQKIYD